MKWLFLLIAFFADCVLLPLALLCVFWTSMVFFAPLIVPSILVIREVRRKNRMTKASSAKYVYKPNALNEYLELLNKE